MEMFRHIVAAKYALLRQVASQPMCGGALIGTPCQFVKRQLRQPLFADTGSWRRIHCRWQLAHSPSRHAGLAQKKLFMSGRNLMV